VATWVATISIAKNPCFSYNENENMNKKEKKEFKNQIIDIFKGPRNLLTFFLNILGMILVGYALIEWGKWFITPGAAIIIGLTLIVIASYFLRPFKDEK